MMPWCAGGASPLKAARNVVFTKYPSSFYLVHRQLPRDVILSSWIEVSAAQRPDLEPETSRHGGQDTSPTNVNLDSSFEDNPHNKSGSLQDSSHPELALLPLKLLPPTSTTPLAGDHDRLPVAVDTFERWNEDFAVQPARRRETERAAAVLDGLSFFSLLLFVFCLFEFDVFFAC